MHVVYNGFLSVYRLANPFCHPNPFNQPNFFFLNLIVASDTKIQYKREDMKEDLTEEDLEKIIDINLVETDTIWLLDMPGVCVSSESEEAPAIRQQNDRYNEVGWVDIGLKDKD